MILFVHGVPDTPVLWQPLVKALGLQPDSYKALALPGFAAPLPAGFTSSKDAYAGWLVEQMESVGEPVHIVGHDWGALLVLRAVCLRPDLVSSWCVTNAVIDPEYNGHRTARMWATPLLGELVMLGMRNKVRLEAGLIEGGISCRRHEREHEAAEELRQPGVCGDGEPSLGAARHNEVQFVLVAFRDGSLILDAVGDAVIRPGKPVALALSAAGECQPTNRLRPARTQARSPPT